MARSDIIATIVILTYNGEAYLRDVLDAVTHQEFDGIYEILVVDSGSTDASLAIIEEFESVRLVEIPNSDFSHGGTRQYAAGLARGRFLCYLTQDAVPVGDTWLSELIAPFLLDARVAIVTGRQSPRRQAFPLQKYEINGVFARLGPSSAITIYGGEVAPLADSAKAEAEFHSDVNAAVRRELVTSSLPFREVPYAEDQLMGRDALSGGWLKAYAGRAVVEHSNDLTLREYSRRVFDETVGLRRIGFDVMAMGWRGRAMATMRGVMADTVRIARDPDYHLVQRARWWIVNPAFHRAKWRAYSRAARVDLSDQAAVDKQSLESSRRR